MQITKIQANAIKEHFAIIKQALLKDSKLSSSDIQILRKLFQDLPDGSEIGLDSVDDRKAAAEMLVSMLMGYYIDDIKKQDTTETVQQRSNEIYFEIRKIGLLSIELGKKHMGVLATETLNRMTYIDSKVNEKSQKAPSTPAKAAPNNSASAKLIEDYKGKIKNLSPSNLQDSYKQVLDNLYDALLQDDALLSTINLELVMASTTELERRTEKESLAEFKRKYDIPQQIKDTCNMLLSKQNGFTNEIDRVVTILKGKTSPEIKAKMQQKAQILINDYVKSAETSLKFISVVMPNSFIKNLDNVLKHVEEIEKLASTAKARNKLIFDRGFTTFYVIAEKHYDEIYGKKNIPEKNHYNVIERLVLDTAGYGLESSRRLKIYQNLLKHLEDTYGVIPDIPRVADTISNKNTFELKKPKLPSPTTNRFNIERNKIIKDIYYDQELSDQKKRALINSIRVPKTEKLPPSSPSRKKP